ncbi:MAG: hypothetical protein RIS47_1117, partial [Bacteroidota bacterium]
QLAGPFSHIFSSKFIVVRGTCGTEQENEALRTLADTILKSWQERYYVSCLMKNDNELTQKDIDTANLLLLGNFGSNCYLKKIAGRLPLKIDSNSIRISNKIVKGERLCFYMVYPNPLNRNRYIGIIGYNSRNGITIDSGVNILGDISSYGTADYKVWMPYSGDKELGFFDSDWTLR